MNIVYVNIEKCRLNQGLTIYTIEKSVGFPKGTIKNWKDSMPSWDKILKVANFLDVSLDFLVGNTQNQKSHKNNSEDCAAAVDELKKVIQEFSMATVDTSAKLNSELERISATYHIEIDPK